MCYSKTYYKNDSQNIKVWKTFRDGFSSKKKNVIANIFMSVPVPKLKGASNTLYVATYCSPFRGKG